MINKGFKFLFILLVLSYIFSLLLNLEKKIDSYNEEVYIKQLEERKKEKRKKCNENYFYSSKKDIDYKKIFISQKRDELLDNILIPSSNSDIYNNESSILYFSEFDAKNVEDFFIKINNMDEKKTLIENFKIQAYIKKKGGNLLYNINGKNESKNNFLKFIENNLENYNYIYSTVNDDTLAFISLNKDNIKIVKKDNIEDLPIPYAKYIAKYNTYIFFPTCCDINYIRRGYIKNKDRLDNNKIKNISISIKKKLFDSARDRTNNFIFTDQNKFNDLDQIYLCSNKEKIYDATNYK